MYAVVSRPELVWQKKTIARGVWMYVTNFGSRAFAVAGPMFWNRLPPEIRANDSLQSFKSQLKTYYF